MNILTLTQTQPACLSINRHHTQSGYAALLTVLVIGAVLLIITLSLTLVTLNTLQMSSTTQLSSRAQAAVEGCVQDALLTLRTDNSLPTQVITPEITCQIQTLSQVGTNWTFTVAGTLNSYQKTITLTANRDGIISLTNWSQ